MERRPRATAPFNGQPDTGRMGFRHDWEVMDERPCLIYREAFWAGPEEEALWLRAVRSCPLSEYGHLDMFAYLRSVGEVATGLQAGKPVQSMPRRGMSRGQMDQRLMQLRSQAVTSSKSGDNP